MNSTSLSLLRRLREQDHEEAWQRFVELYAPLIVHWARGQGLGATDASDLTQDVMTVLVKELRRFEYDPQKRRFRGWLRTITVNKSRDYLRRHAVRPSTGHEETIGRHTLTGDGDMFEEAEYRSYLVNRALELMKSEFKTETWQACWKQVVEDQTANDVADRRGNGIVIECCLSGKVTCSGTSARRIERADRISYRKLAELRQVWEGRA